MALYINHCRMSFRYVPDSVNLYCVSTIIFFRPWVHLKLVFGNQVCYEGYLYFYETYKDISTEFGILKVQVLLSSLYPFITHHFILKPSICDNSSQ